MTGEQIWRHFEATPFVPFRDHMASGRSADVPRPDFMHLSPSGRWLMVDLPDDTVEVIDVLLSPASKRFREMEAALAD